jgi:hypothetical protein
LNGAPIVLQPPLSFTQALLPGCSPRKQKGNPTMPTTLMPIRHAAPTQREQLNKQSDSALASLLYGNGIELPVPFTRQDAVQQLLDHGVRVVRSAA